MQIAVIGGTTIIKDALEQVPPLKSFHIHFFNEYQDTYGNFDLCIFNEITPIHNNTYNNQIIISNKLKGDLNKPFRLNFLVELIINKLNQKDYKLGKITFFPSKRTLELDENLIILTEKETRLILYMVKNFPRGIPKSELLEKIWEYSSRTETSTLEVHLSRLKQKLTENGFPDFLSYKEKFLYIDI